jgi:colanic acid/amylovoran biosynthesis glycosyltransferase
MLTMDRPLRIAIFVGMFPVVSETFILRQIVGLLALGHHVDIYADIRSSDDSPCQAEVEEYKLLERTTFMDMPQECAPWELSVWPLSGETWVPGGTRPVPNFLRAMRALPIFLRALTVEPRLAMGVLSRAEYGFQAQSLSVLYRLNKLLEKPARYDVLHAHFGPTGNSFRFARQLWRAPLLVSFHGYDFTTIPRKQGPAVYHKLFAEADLITVNSQFTRRSVAQLGCPEQKLKLLPVGLELGAFPFKERIWRAGEPLRLLTVARLVEIKGHEFAIRALANLRQVYPNLRYDIIGEGPLRKKLENLIVELGLGETVFLHGARDGRFIHQLMASAHIGLLASVSVEGDQEGQGLFLQEAQASGLPVVATKHGALPQGILPGKSGLLAPEGDSQALANQLKDLIAHPEAWPMMGLNGRKFVETRYDIRKLNQQLTQLYETARQQFHCPSQS